MLPMVSVTVVGFLVLMRLALAVASNVYDLLPVWVIDAWNPAHRCCGARE